MKLIIEGDNKKIEALARELQLRAKRNNLTITLSGTTEKKNIVDNVSDLVVEPAVNEYVDKVQEDKLPEQVQISANEVKLIIEKVRSVKELNKFKDDTRQIVVIAYKKKLKELTGK